MDELVPDWFEVRRIVLMRIGHSPIDLWFGVTARGGAQVRARHILSLSCSMHGQHVMVDSLRWCLV